MRELPRTGVTAGAFGRGAGDLEAVAVRLRMQVCAMVCVALALCMAGAEAAAASGWSLQAAPLPTIPNGQLSGVSCSSGSACTAVGYFTNSAGVGVTLAEVWNGTSWTIQRTPGVGGSSQSGLSGVSCTSTRACMAVGYVTSRARVGVTLAELWNGVSWTLRGSPMPYGARGSSLSGVSCASRGVCIAVGSFTDHARLRVALAERWSGSRWTIQRIPTPAGARSSSLRGVSCSSAAACTAVGFASRRGPLVERWNGSRWLMQRTPKAGILNGVSCTSRKVCTAVGSFAGATLAERWNGARWSIERTANPMPPSNNSNSTYSIANGLNSVSCASARACIAVGSSSTDSQATGGSGYESTTTALLAESWNGARWAIRRTPEAKPLGQDVTVIPELTGVSCTSRRACTAVGPYANAAALPVTLAERWDGASWTVQSTPNPRGEAGSSKGGTLAGVSCSSTTACTAVGYFDTLANSFDNEVTLAERWNGVAWTVQSTPNPKAGTDNELSGVSCTSATACTAVGSFVNQQGNALTLAERFDGRRWTIQRTPNPPGAGDPELSGVSCTSATACTAVGSYINNSNASDAPLAERWDGTSWTIQSTTPTSPGGEDAVLNAVSCTSATACTAVGVSGDALTFAEAWNGRNWTIQSTPNPSGRLVEQLYGVSCTSATACTAVGGPLLDSGLAGVTLAEFWNGTNWTIQSTPNPSGASLNGVSCTSATDCRAVGNYIDDQGDNGPPLVERWDGTSWTIQVTPNFSGDLNEALNGVSCAAATACTAVGGDLRQINSSTPPLAEGYF
jgi:hypothetical protein